MAVPPPIFSKQQDRQDHREIQVRPGLKALRAIRDPKARKLLMDLPPLKVIQVLKVRPDPRVKQLMMARRERQARQARKDP